MGAPVDQNQPTERKMAELGIQPSQTQEIPVNKTVPIEEQQPQQQQYAQPAIPLQVMPTEEPL